MATNALGIVNRLQVGGEVETTCGKCKETRDHVIAALNDKGEIARVQCRVCGSNHIYRPRKTTTRTAGTRTTRSRKDSSPEPNGELRPYTMQDRFVAGDGIMHPKFGVGVVVEVRAGKIDVKFGRELKTLVHAV